MLHKNPEKRTGSEETAVSLLYLGRALQGVSTEKQPKAKCN